MNRRQLAAFVLAVALPAVAWAEDPQQPPVQEAAVTEAPAKSHSTKGRWFAGGGVGASFGSVDSVMIAPMLGFHVVPRFDVGTQLYYRWTDDSRYSPSVSTTDYGVTLFARARVIAQFFLEADVQYENYEYFVGNGTNRDNYTTFLAGAGYGFPMGRNASFYVSALYDFGYDANDQFRPYDDPWRVQVGASVGF